LSARFCELAIERSLATNSSLLLVSPLDSGHYLIEIHCLGSGHVLYCNALILFGQD
jgi:hypothetical protein